MYARWCRSLAWVTLLHPAPGRCVAQVATMRNSDHKPVHAEFIVTHLSAKPLLRIKTQVVSVSNFCSGQLPPIVPSMRADARGVRIGAGPGVSVFAFSQTCMRERQSE